MIGSPTRSIVVGAIVGVTWAAGLRAWMAQLIGLTSTVSWRTVLLVLLPGAAVGALLAWGWWTQSFAAGPSRWRVLSPVLFATALLDPEILRELIRSGQGGGALIVVVTAIAGGVLFSRRRWSSGRVLATPVWVLGVGVVTVMGTMAARVTTSRGAWACLFGGSLIVVLSLASALPHRGGCALPVTTLPWVGAVAGLAWAASLRGLMATLAGDDSTVTWSGTFGAILLPGVVIGLVLGWAELKRRREEPVRAVVWAPLLFMIGVPFVADFTRNGLARAGGAVVVALVMVVGAYALAGRRGPLRTASRVLFGGALAAWAPLAGAAGGDSLRPDTALGMWLALLYTGLLATAALAGAVPLRAGPRGPLDDAAPTDAVRPGETRPDDRAAARSTTRQGGRHA